jgi:hypothetical protein
VGQNYCDRPFPTLAVTRDAVRQVFEPLMQVLVQVLVQV